jgi:hypothetical protein
MAGGLAGGVGTENKKNARQQEGELMKLSDILKEV